MYKASFKPRTATFSNCEQYLIAKQLEERKELIVEFQCTQKSLRFFAGPHLIISSFTVVAPSNFIKILIVEKYFIEELRASFFSDKKVPPFCEQEQKRTFFKERAQKPDPSP